MYQLEFLPAALEDMSEIIRYISHDLDNKTAAIKLSEKFVSSAEKLKDFPYAHPVYQPIRPLEKEYRKCVVKNYLMFYTVDEADKVITVSRVIYGKRDTEKML